MSEEQPSLHAFEQEATEEPMQSRLREEIADVFLYLLLVAERTGIDLQQVANEKIAVNASKYPVEKARGTAAKYTQL